MNAPTQAEILDKCKQSAKEGRDACQWLARNADPEQAAPRGRHYKNLRTALEEIEGCCRQMTANRDDCRWLPLGILCAKMMRAARKRMLKQDWLGFRDVGKFFDLVLRRTEELATAKTGKVGMILPKNPSSWLILKDEQPYQPLWTPQSRSMN